MLRQFEKDKIFNIVQKYYTGHFIKNMIDAAVDYIDYNMWKNDKDFYEQYCYEYNQPIRYLTDEQSNDIRDEIEKKVLNKIITWAELKLKEAEK